MKGVFQTGRVRKVNTGISWNIPLKITNFIRWVQPNWSKDCKGVGATNSCAQKRSHKKISMFLLPGNDLLTAHVDEVLSANDMLNELYDIDGRQRFSDLVYRDYGSVGLELFPFREIKSMKAQVI